MCIRDSCLALAEELAHRGWEIAFALGGPHAGRVAAAGWTVFRPLPSSLPNRLRRWLRAAIGHFRPGPAYLFFSNLNFQVVRDGFHTPQAVRQEVEWELDVVNRFRPHVLIGDVWLLTSIVGRLAGLPVVQIVRAAAHPVCPQLIWWRALPPPGSLAGHRPDLQPGPGAVGAASSPAGGGPAGWGHPASPQHPGIGSSATRC